MVVVHENLDEIYNFVTPAASHMHCFLVVSVASGSIARPIPGLSITQGWFGHLISVALGWEYLRRVIRRDQPALTVLPLHPGDIFPVLVAVVGPGQYKAV